MLGGLLCFVLVLALNIATEGTPTTEVTAKQQYEAIIAEIQNKIKSPHFTVLDEASRGLQQPIDVPAVIEGPLMRIYEAKIKEEGEQDYSNIYIKFITKPCEQILNLEKRLDEFLKMNSEFQGSQDLPLNYYDLVKLCRQEDESRRAEGQKQYDEIIAEIKELNGIGYSVLTESAQLLEKRLHDDGDSNDDDSNNDDDDYDYDDGIKKMGAQVLAQPLLDASKDSKHKDRNFDHVYSQFVEEPCEKVLDLGTKLAICLDQYPQIDDQDNLNKDLPDFFVKLVEICHIIKDEKGSILAEFEKLTPVLIPDNM